MRKEREGLHLPPFFSGREHSQERGVSLRNEGEHCCRARQTSEPVLRKADFLVIKQGKIPFVRFILQLAKTAEVSQGTPSKDNKEGCRTCNWKRHNRIMRRVEPETESYLLHPCIRVDLNQRPSNPCSRLSPLHYKGLSDEELL